MNEFQPGSSIPASFRIEDCIAPWKVRALAATLDTGTGFSEGDPLPPGWHWMFFSEPVPTRELGEDGHPSAGAPSPEFPRRMWAGGKIEFMGPLKIGSAYTRTSSVKSTTKKRGKTGGLLFVTLGHRYMHGDQTLIVEEQNLVYRGPAPGGNQTQAGREPVAADTPAISPAWRIHVDASPVLLFRYSALTFNAHRIHYDRDYVVGRENYPGLVVHGPLQATLLLEMCRKHGAAVRIFEYRAARPLIADRGPFALCGTPSPDGTTAALWTEDAQGGQGMTALAHFAGHLPQP